MRKNVMHKNSNLFFEFKFVYLQSGMICVLCDL